jgi:hypothetical protein
MCGGTSVKTVLKPVSAPAGPASQLSYAQILGYDVTVRWAAWHIHYPCLTFAIVSREETVWPGLRETASRRGLTRRSPRAVAAGSVAPVRGRSHHDVDGIPQRLHQRALARWSPRTSL